MNAMPHSTNRNCTHSYLLPPRLEKDANYLLKGQKLHDTQIYTRVEAKTAFVRSKGLIKLHTKSTIYMSLPLVIYPGHSEDYNSLWFHQSL